MKNEIKKHIFKEIKTILTFSLIIQAALINSLKSEELKEIKINIRYKNATPKVSKYCDRVDNGYIYVYDGGAAFQLICDRYDFKDSNIAPNKYTDRNNEVFCLKKTNNIHGAECSNQNIYKHILPDNTIMYSTSSDPNHFKDKINNYPDNLEGYISPMDLLKSMPEIGVSRVDPNLIEY